MPSLMIHLLTANKYNPEATVPFWIGNIAPDSVSEREEKDKTHFRDRTDRIDALRELAQNIDLQDDFSRGLLMHLFLDYCWDSYPMSNFIKSYTNGNWFPAYRHEIALAGCWLFHHSVWGKSIWNQMIAWPMPQYNNVNGIVRGDMTDFIKRNAMWHAENNIGPSSVFTPDFVEDFTTKVAVDFRKWLQTI
jgi:hypothetical protein